MMRRLAIAAGLLLAPLAAHADPPRVYATFTANPAPPAEPIALPAQPSVIDAGSDASAPSTACAAGVGDEICGFELRVDATEDLVLTGFTGEGATVSNLEARRLRVSRLDAAAGTLGPARIGALSLNATTPGALAVASGRIATAGLATTPIPADVIATPEASALGSGAAALLALVWRQTRRACSLRQRHCRICSDS